jgi:ubiquinone/menaquinone biosynthesis C-methylase UbiE
VRRLTNITIHEGDVYRLPFPDGSFDAVYEHTLFMHLREPERAAAEAFRVLKSGGCFGGRDGDNFGWLWSPSPLDTFQACHEVTRQYLRMRGTNYFFGRQLASVVHRAGFQDILPTASYEMFNTPETRAVAVRIWEGLFTDPRAVEFAQERGVDLAARVPIALAELRAWADEPGAYLALPECEVVAWKP